MDATQIIAHLKGLEPQLRRWGLGSLYLFGSRARGDHQTDSDVDLLFDAEGGEVNLWQRAEIMATLVDQLGIQVDLVERKALWPQIRAEVEAELVKVY